ncbi:IclR family transcriptional regulator [Ideonella sp. A 288]|uniref:IclR family transcriptional regulator n=1 Tax=Ideonella sp. A 288 TaxID=1962181 RepID=UPI000B4A78AA|nr:IclR family transcriptional regulator [Ideonella sp. A 288]
MRRDDHEPEDRAQRSVQSVEVGGRLLMALAAHPAPMTLKDLAAAADLPPSRAHPYLVSFGRLRLIEQDAVNGRYALGPAALQLGLACLKQLDVLKAANPVADTLATGTGHAVALAVWGNFGPTVVRMMDARQPLHVAMRVGTVMSLLGTATGRAFAAVLPPAQLAEALPGALGDEPDGRSAAVKAAALRDAEAEYRSHGVNRAVGRPIPGINAFSAPAFDHDGHAVLVVTVLDHHERLSSDWESPSVTAVRQAATEISARLGWNGPAA